MDSPLRRALIALANRQSLSEDQTAEVFGVVMAGEATPAQIGGLLMGLRAKGETADELAGAARALRGAMVRVTAAHDHLVDTCGTGGGSVPTFNISTVAAFVAAGAGAVVPKHGNRSFTSRCGSADVLEALGIRIVLDAPSATRVLNEARVVFLFAPNFHPAMKHVGAVRRELGTPSLMNLVGPLANPAGVRRQVIGVAEPNLAAGRHRRLGGEGRRSAKLGDRSRAVPSRHQGRRRAARRRAGGECRAAGTHFGKWVRRSLGTGGGPAQRRCGDLRGGNCRLARRRDRARARGRRIGGGAGRARSPAQSNR